jgi:hypothetical protein
MVGCYRTETLQALSGMGRLVKRGKLFEAWVVAWNLLARNQKLWRTLVEQK